jgi:hypothetical protein
MLWWTPRSKSNSIWLTAGTGDLFSGSHFAVCAGASTSLTVSGGSGDTLLAANNDTLTDQATGTLFEVGTGVSTLKNQDFGADTTGVIDLLNGVGGYATSAAAYAALTSDGAGGSQLSLGGGAPIDFVATTKNQLSAANIKIA